MIASSIQPTLQESLVAALVAAFSTRPAAALIVTPTVHLYTAVSAPVSPNSLIADFTEATFAGYANQTVTLSGPRNFPNNLGLGEGGPVAFVASSGITTPGQSCLGYWIDDGVSTIYAAEAFPTPILFVHPYDYLELTILLGCLYAPRQQ